jgi:hypothetical protein
MSAATADFCSSPTAAAQASKACWCSSSTSWDAHGPSGTVSNSSRQYLEFTPVYDTVRIRCGCCCRCW